jgi:hypothetical protein
MPCGLGPSGGAPPAQQPGARCVRCAAPRSVLTRQSLALPCRRSAGPFERRLQRQPSIAPPPWRTRRRNSSEGGPCMHGLVLVERLRGVVHGHITGCGSSCVSGEAGASPCSGGRLAARLPPRATGRTAWQGSRGRARSGSGAEACSACVRGNVQQAAGRWHLAGPAGGMAWHRVSWPCRSQLPQCAPAVTRDLLRGGSALPAHARTGRARVAGSRGRCCSAAANGAARAAALAGSAPHGRAPQHPGMPDTP